MELEHDSGDSHSLSNVLEKGRMTQHSNVYDKRALNLAERNMKRIFKHGNEKDRTNLCNRLTEKSNIQITCYEDYEKADINLNDVIDIVGKLVGTNIRATAKLII